MLKNLTVISTFLIFFVSFNCKAGDNSIYVKEDKNGSKVLNLKMIQQHQNEHNKENHVDIRSYTPNDLRSSSSAEEALSKVAQKAINKAIGKKKIYRKVASHKTSFSAAEGAAPIKVEMKTLAGIAKVEYGSNNKTKLDINLVQKRVALEFVKKIAKDAKFFISTKLEGSESSENLGFRWDW